MNKKLTKLLSLTAFTAMLGLFSVIPAHASELYSTQTKSFGGSDFDRYFSIKPTSDGGYIAVGDSHSTDMDLVGLNKGDADAIVVKYDANGSVQWRKSFGGTGADIFQHITIAKDGGFVAVGYGSSVDGDMVGLTKGGNGDAFMVKYDANGNMLWKKSFGGTARNDRFYSIQTTSDGGFVVAGESGSTDGDMTGLNKGAFDGILVKYDPNGNLQWKKSFGGTGTERFFSIQITEDGGFVASGEGDSSNGDLSGLNKGIFDAILVKFDSSGNVQWKKAFGGSGHDTFRFAERLPDGGIVAVGQSESSDKDMNGFSKGSSEGIVVKYDASGSMLWKRVFAGSRSEHLFSAQSTDDGGVIVVGESNSVDGDLTELNKGGYDAILMKYDSVGSLQWVKNFGGNASDNFYAIEKGNDGSFVTVGESSSTDGDLTGLNKGYADAIMVTFVDGSPLTPATFSADKTTLTNSDVIVTITYPDQATVKEFKIGENGTWQAYTSPVVVSDNETIFARSRDGAGISSEESSYVVNNIDKVAPVPATFTADKTEPTNGNVTVTVHFPEDATTKEVKIGEGGAWTTYTSSVLVSANEVVFTRSKDEAGNLSASSKYSVTNIDKTPPLLSITQSTITPTNEDVIMTVDVMETGSGVDVMKFAKGLYSVGYFASNGSVVIGNSFAVSSNGTYSVYVRDVAGNESIQTFNIFNIDKVAPTAPTLTHNKNVVTIQGGVDAEGVKETLVNINNAGWNVYTTTLTLEDGDYDIQAKTVDLAGNESLIVTSHFTIYETALQKATEEVVRAEQLKSQEQIDKARELVNALPNVPEKEALKDRLDAIVPDTDGATPPTEEGDVIPNKDLPSEIGKLTDPADKKTFSDILKAIERAEANPTNRVLVQIAWDKVKAVPDSVRNNMANKKIFNSLYKRAEKLKDDFNAGLEQEELQLAIKKATDYVVSYEKYKTAYYKTKAQEAVNVLPAGETKTALQARIDAVVVKA